MEPQQNKHQLLPSFLAFILKHCHVTGPYEYEFFEENILMIEAATIEDAYRLAAETASSWNTVYKNAYEFDVICKVKDIRMDNTFDCKRQKVTVVSVRDFTDYDVYKRNFKN